MGITLIDSMKEESALCSSIAGAIDKLGMQYNYFPMRELEIKPCRNCGGCQFKSPGECVFTDDNPKILKSMVHSEALIIITTITFGGYNSLLKKTMDKWSTLGLPIFVVRGGRLQHPSRYTDPGCTGVEQMKITIGIGSNLEEDEKQSFRQLVAANDGLMNPKGHTFIIDARDDFEEMIKHITVLLKEEVAK